MTEGYLESRGIAYRRSDFKPGRKTLLLIHGFSSSSSAWKPFEKLFEQQYNLVIPDLRGCGLSKRWPRVREYALTEHAEDLAELLAFLNITGCVAVGYSIGALVTLALGIKHSIKITRMVYVSPTYQLHRLWRLRLTRPLMLLGVAAAKLFPVTPRRLWRVDYTNYKDAGDENISRLSEDIRSTGLRAYMYSLRQWYAFHYDEWWSQLKYPTLILHGNHDTVVPRSSMLRLMQKIPHARLVELTEGDHMLVYRHSDWVAREISTFVETGG